MRNLLNFLLKYNNIIVFIILESVALSLLFTRNEYHNSRFVKGGQIISGGIEERISNARSYLSLREINSSLAAENSALRNSLEKIIKNENMAFSRVKDTVFRQQYQYTSAEVINNSVNKRKNYFTLNKGSRQGMKVDMAVSNGSSIAGVIVGCSNNYSVAISVLNIDFRVSARLRSNGYFGSLSWDGHNQRYAVLNEIPQNVNVSIGDTVETTGYSAIFPEGMQVGTVSDLKKSGSDFYKITVELTTDFKKLHFVNVIGNMKKVEETNLEKQFQ
jgi:rod shape-determining protein MreC